MKEYLIIYFINKKADREYIAAKNPREAVRILKAKMQAKEKSPDIAKVAEVIDAKEWW